LYPYVRFATCASLIAFIGLIGVGGLASLYQNVGRALPASSEVPRPDTVPTVATRGTEPEVPLTASASAPPSHENESQPPPPTLRTATPSPELLPPSPEPLLPSQLLPQRVPTAPEQGTPIDPHAAGTLQVERPSIRTKARAPAPKKTAHHRPGERRRTNEALNSVRRFGDRLHDVPVNAYAADRTRRSIPIRPTSIQDIYYYSISR
jgi:hypothetical protein